jgi:hypothetical protein
VKKVMVVLSLALSVFAFAPAQADEGDVPDEMYNSEFATDYNANPEIEDFQRIPQLRTIFLGQVRLGINRSQVSLNTRRRYQCGSGAVWQRPMGKTQCSTPPFFTGPIIAMVQLKRPPRPLCSPYRSRWRHG